MLLGAGLTIALLAPEPFVPVPELTEHAADSIELQYVRSLPDAGDPLLERPVGVATDGEHVYVADSSAGVVRVFTVAGFDAGEIGRGTLDTPTYVTRDMTAGTLLVTDRGRNAVFRFGTDGGELGDLTPSTDTTTTWEPLGITADGEGLIAVTDVSERHQVLVMDRTGRVERTLGGPLGTEGPEGVVVALDFPNSVGFWGDELWVGDSNNQRVLVFGPRGGLVRVISVRGVARGLTFLNGETTRFAALVDALSSEIVLLDASGEEVGRYGGPGNTAGKLAYPNDVAYDAGTSQLFVADTGNARVQVWSVTWPDDSEGPLEILSRAQLPPMLLAGLLLGLAGMVVLIATLWPRRRTAQELLPDSESDSGTENLEW